MQIHAYLDPDPQPCRWEFFKLKLGNKTLLKFTETLSLGYKKNFIYLLSPKNHNLISRDSPFRAILIKP